MAANPSHRPQIPGCQDPAARLRQDPDRALSSIQGHHLLITIATDNVRRRWAAQGFGGYIQYCSLNDCNPLGDIDAARALPLPGPQIVVAHLALHAAEIDPVSAGDDTLLQDLPQDRLMQDVPLPRGE